MLSCWSDVIGGYENFVKEQKKEDGKFTFSLHAFDTKHEKPVTFDDIKVVSESLSELNISPRGATALYDAIGQAINDTGARLRQMDEKDRPGKVLVVVQTDGWENSSREFTAANIKQMIKEQEEKYNWKFMFMGANLDAVKDATVNLGFKVDMATFYDTKNTDKQYGVLTDKVSCLRSAVDVSTADLAYTADERKALTE